MDFFCDKCGAVAGSLSSACGETSGCRYVQRNGAVGSACQRRQDHHSELEILYGNTISEQSAFLQSVSDDHKELPAFPAAFRCRAVSDLRCRLLFPLCSGGAEKIFPAYGGTSVPAVFTRLLLYRSLWALLYPAYRDLLCFGRLMSSDGERKGGEEKDRCRSPGGTVVSCRNGRSQTDRRHLPSVFAACAHPKL